MKTNNFFVLNSTLGLGNILFMVYAFLISAPPQIAMSLFVLGMNVYGYKSWSNNE